MKMKEIKMAEPCLQEKNTRLPGNRQTDLVVYVLIGVTVIFFNLIAIFGCDVLLHDDPLWYTYVLKGKFPVHLMKFSPLVAYKEWMAWNIMAYSPQLARGLYVLLLMVPLSCCFYYLLHTRWGFPRLAAFTAAALPNILPHHWQIPAGINMSYTLWGLLFSVFALMMGFYYLENSTSKNWLRLLGAVILYLIALQLMEQALFLFPPLAVAFWGYTKFNRKHIWLVFCFFICAVAKFIHLLFIPRKPITNVPLEEIITRIGLYFKWALPSPDIDPLFITIAYAVFVIIGFMLVMRQATAEKKPIAINKNFSHLRKKGYFLYLYLFLFCWAVSSILVFIFFSEPYRIRYVHISAFGLNALLIMSLYVILNRGLARKLKFNIAVLIGIIIFSGVYRYDVLNKYYSYLNHTKAIIVKDLEKVNLPENAQVVITGIKDFPGSWLPGGWARASGYLKFVLKREDVTGLIGPVNSSEYYNFDNHFNPKIRRYRERWYMTGLSINKPVFLFALLEKKQKLHQFQYALQWKGYTKNAPWTILRVNKKTGKIKPFLKGAGLKDYRAKLKQLEKKGIRQSQVLWGGPPTKVELKRLQRLELDPQLFQKGFYYYIFKFKKVQGARLEQILSLLKNLEPTAREISFGNSLRLEFSFLDGYTDESGKSIKNIKFLNFLWRSMAKQTINSHRLQIFLLKNQKFLWKASPKFCQAGLELEPGDYIWGSVRMPGNTFEKADHIRVRLSSTPGRVTPKGKGLLIPITQLN